MIKSGRFHIRLSKFLEQEIKDYAKRHNTTVTALIEQSLQLLLQQEKLECSGVEVGEQI